MSEMHVLLIHGMTGSGPWHWQHWLAAQLRDQGVRVDLPSLPDPDRPVLDRWLPVLRERLEAVPREAELVVAAHSCGVALWLHHAATIAGRDRRADRVLLVSPPALDWRHPDAQDITPYPTDAAALRRAAGITRLVVGTGDPYLSMYRAHALAADLQVEMDVILDGEHLNTDAGYGPWPSVLRWALYGSVPLNDRFDTDTYTAGPSQDRLRLV
ncbi:MULTISPECIES: RBBP9/YdeN family alpha/beta hydrolase [Saccharopolyspora]|uniref:Serine hydrolase family protein n=1 Tax=Saccharopolyspora elongata TaxID=2530387 RepID=A0A4R4YGJ7_9PSEU|nr:alpha/beta hydrolase [Saccharopolyspora elongata]TDD43955.1 serine hydrolase family protein [Saccharopolyspora elongata]